MTLDIVGVAEYITEEPITTLGNQNYFHVTAYISPSNWLVLVDGDFFNGDVTIDPFYINKYEVTQSEFVDVMGEWEFNFEGNPTHPAENVNWFDAIEYCNRLSIREGLEPVYFCNGRAFPDLWYDQWPGWNDNDDNHTNITCDWEADGYRLPTETEWHHAANAGIYDSESEWPYGSFYQYSGSNDADSVAWYYDNAENTTHPVGELSPNGLGIYDMSGNVFEWCWDIYGNVWPPEVDNPRGADGGIFRVSRGGSWNRFAVNCAISGRGIYYPTSRNNFIGIRVCRVIPDFRKLVD